MRTHHQLLEEHKLLHDSVERLAKALKPESLELLE